jgi:hypothetical protein
MALQLRERKSPFIHQRHGDVPVRLCKGTVALHRRLGTSHRSCCYSEGY